MNNKKGQSLMEIIFSIGIVVLVLTGVIVLVVNVAKSKRISTERKVAVELSQKLIENKISEIKNNPLSFWSVNHSNESGNHGSDIDAKFSDYLYDIEYKDCDSSSCNIVFTIKWEDSNQTLSVERLFLKTGT